MNTILEPGSGRHAVRHSAFSIFLSGICGILLLTGVCPAQTSGVITLNFEGLLNDEPILDYYNGLYGGFGTGPGPNYGISFGADSQAVISYAAGGTGSFSGNPSGVTTASFSTGTGVWMNATKGFSNGFSFYYSNYTAGTVTVYDGLNGTGNVLKTISLPPTQTSADCPVTTAQFCRWQQSNNSFSGIARSVSFSGAVNAIGFDNITIGAGVATSPLVITTTSLPAGTVGVGYNAPLSATGGTTPYTWTATGLPLGLTVTNGSISGTPTTPGTYPVSLRVTDSSGPPLSATSQALTLIISPALGTPICNFGTATYAPGTAYTNTCTVSGGAPPYTWTVSGLPSGVTYNPTTGSSTTISGIVPASGSYPVTVTAKDSSANGGPPKSVPTFTISVATKVNLSCTNTSGPAIVNVPWATTCSATGTPPYRFTIGGSLPAGITNTSAATATTIGGSPTSPGTYSFTVVVQDGSGQTSTPPQSFNGTISPAPSLNTFSFTAVPSVANQNTVNLTLSSALLVNPTGKLCLTFSADPSVVGSYQGQEVVYANGTKDSACSSALNRTLGFTIAAGSTTPVWDGGNSSQFSPGTVAGTVTVTLISLVDPSNLSVLPSATPLPINIPVAAPTVGSPTLTTSSSSVTVVVTGVTPKRSVTGATYVFNPSSSQPITASVSFTSGSFAAMDQSQWFGTPASLATGGSFSLSATFSCTNCSALTGVQVTLSN